MCDDTGTHASDSAVQRSIETAFLGRVDNQNADWTRVAWIDVSKKNQLPDVWRKVKPDAVWETKSGDLIVAECYTRTEKLKPGNHAKLAKDCLKLIAIQRALTGKTTVRCLLILPDELAEQLQGSGWLATVIRQTVEIVCMALPTAERNDLNVAVLNQAEGQSRTRRNRNVSE